MIEQFAMLPPFTQITIVVAAALVLIVFILRAIA